MIDVEHLYNEVDFVIGSQFIRHALDDSEPTAAANGQTTETRVYTGLRRRETRVVSILREKFPRLVLSKNSLVQIHSRDWLILMFTLLGFSLQIGGCKCQSNFILIGQASEEILVAPNTEVLRADVGEARLVWISTGMQKQRKREIPEETCKLAVSSGMFPTCERPRVTPPGIETASNWWEFFINALDTESDHTDAKRPLIPRTPAAHANKMSPLARNISPNSARYPMLFASRQPQLTGNISWHAPMGVIEVNTEQHRNEGAGETDDPEKTRRRTASSVTIPTCENPVTRPRRAGHSREKIYTQTKLKSLCLSLQLRSAFALSFSFPHSQTTNQHKPFKLVACEVTCPRPTGHIRRLIEVSCVCLYRNIRIGGGKGQSVMVLFSTVLGSSSHNVFERASTEEVTIAMSVCG
ncbi:hypothetical protein PR048_022752 [Dryococelus australis]|uniref:Uncharacterized protein n=1 Tax=Dryococelus australis TaxID=614101 RepID=A0ABQ9GS44_9NEOP|nr:hypothetical protein PR048_022752 [Dryococelus australis]